MKVWLIGFTSALPSIMQQATDGEWSSDWGTGSADLLAEFAGRACYQSWDKPNPATRANDAYLANIIRRGHESVFNHASFTFYVTGVSRALTHELIRHRFLGFSELSQRYVDMDGADFIMPPAFEVTELTKANAVEFENLARVVYNKALVELREHGITGKKAREAARAFMPNMTETKLVVSGNVRAWRDFLKQRMTPDADAEIYAFAGEIFGVLSDMAPHSFQDFGREETA